MSCEANPNNEFTRPKGTIKKRVEAHSRFIPRWCAKKVDYFDSWIARDDGYELGPATRRLQGVTVGSRCEQTHEEQPFPTTATRLPVSSTSYLHLAEWKLSPPKFFTPLARSSGMVGSPKTPIAATTTCACTILICPDGTSHTTRLYNCSPASHSADKTSALKTVCWSRAYLSARCFQYDWRAG
jgi:hypothetical protein